MTSKAQIGRTEQVLLVVATSVATVLLLVAPGTWGDPRALLGGPFRFLVLMLPAAIVLTTMHEVAHAVVGRLTGWQLFGMTLGQGRLLLAIDRGGRRLELRGVLVGGATFANPTGRRWRDASMLAAGVAVEAIAIASALFWSPSSAWASTARWAVISVAAVDIVANLWPRQVDVGPVTGIATDGAQLRMIVAHPDRWRDDVEHRRLTRSQARIVQSMHGGDLDDAMRLATAEAATEPSELTDMLLGGLLLAQHRWREAYDLWGPLANGSPDDHLALNNAAVAAVMTFDQSLLGDADRWSARAYELRPDEPACASTRGSTLTMLGRADEGAPLLRQADSGGLSRQQRAFVEAFAALTAFRQERPDDARKHLAASRSLHDECPAIPPIARLITNWPAPRSADCVAPG